MAKKTKLDDKLYEEFKKRVTPRLKKMKARIDKAEQVKKDGGNAYKQIEARLMDVDTGKLIQDPVITAIQYFDTKKDAQSFYKGYAENIANNPKKYPKQVKGRAKEYAAYDIKMALDLHFTESKTHKLWKSILPKKTHIFH